MNRQHQQLTTGTADARQGNRWPPPIKLAWRFTTLCLLIASFICLAIWERSAETADQLSLGSPLCSVVLVSEDGRVHVFGSSSSKLVPWSGISSSPMDRPIYGRVMIQDPPLFTRNFHVLHTCRVYENVPPARFKRMMRFKQQYLVAGYGFSVPHWFFAALSLGGAWTMLLLRRFRLLHLLAWVTYVAVLLAAGVGEFPMP